MIGVDERLETLEPIQARYILVSASVSAVDTQVPPCLPPPINRPPGRSNGPDEPRSVSPIDRVVLLAGVNDLSKVGPGA